MANIVKRINKHAGQSLLDGERVIGALNVTPKGTLRVAALGGTALGGTALGKLPRTASGTEGRAVAFTNAVRWVALTDRRFLAYSGQLKPKDLVFACDLAHIDRIEVNARVQRHLSFVFDDGSVAHMEAFRTGNDFPGFSVACAAAGKLIES